MTITTRTTTNVSTNSPGEAAAALMTSFEHSTAQELADAVLAEAVQETEQAKRSRSSNVDRGGGVDAGGVAVTVDDSDVQATTDAEHVQNSFRTIDDNSESNTNDHEADKDPVHQQLRDLWSKARDTQSNKRKTRDHDSNDDDNNHRKTTVMPVFAAATSLLKQEIDHLTQMGVQACVAYHAVMRNAEHLKEDLQAAQMELECLRATDETKRKTIANLLHIKEVWAVQAREGHEAALDGAALRADIATLASQLYDANTQSEDNKRQVELLTEQLHEVRTKLVKVSSDKLQLERERRTTLSLARNATTSDRAETDYYKKKLQEANSRLQSVNAVLAEKDRQLDEYRRLMDRHLTGNSRGDRKSKQY